MMFDIGKLVQFNVPMWAVGFSSKSLKRFEANTIALIVAYYMRTNNGYKSHNLLLFIDGMLYETGTYEFETDIRIL